MKTVFHLPDGDSGYGRRALRNAENLLDDDTIDAEVRIVTNSGGIDPLLADAPTAATVRSLVDEGVDVCVCRNTVRNAGHAPDEFVEGVRIVSSAMAELTRAQDAGFAYVRP